MWRSLTAPTARFRLLCCSAIAVLAADAGYGSITIGTVTIGSPGNAADARVMNDGTSGYGSVGYVYAIGSTEVTNAQYAAFLNAKAAADPYGLYSTNMAGSSGGIARSGSSGSYQYATVAGRADNPVNFVSFWDAARFVNWLHNGQGAGDTETGAYTLGGVTNPANASVTRNLGWTWAIASEDEWYKAAYFQPASAGGPAGDYWLFPTSGDSISNAQANYLGSGFGGTVPVGSYAPNFHGALDMAGNLREWNDAIVNATLRGVRGGSFSSSSSALRATFRDSASPANGTSSTGFRVTHLPGPASLALLALGALGARGRRRSA